MSDAMTPRQCNEWITGYVFSPGTFRTRVVGQDGPTLPDFSSSHDAFALAWARLTEEQKQDMCVQVESEFPQANAEELMAKMLDATPLEKCRWLIESWRK